MEISEEMAEDFEKVKNLTRHAENAIAAGNEERALEKLEEIGHISETWL